MADMATVNEWTRNGKGLQTESGHWINNDLCSSNRRANFIAREERRKRQKRQKLDGTGGYILYSNVNGLINKTKYEHVYVYMMT